MGIGMAHMELALNEKKIHHQWFTEKPDLITDDLTEYIASCRII